MPDFIPDSTVYFLITWPGNGTEYKYSLAAEVRIHTVSLLLHVSACCNLTCLHAVCVVCKM